VINKVGVSRGGQLGAIKTTVGIFQQRQELNRDPGLSARRGEGYSTTAADKGERKWCSQRSNPEWGWKVNKPVTKGTDGKKGKKRKKCRTLKGKQVTPLWGESNTQTKTKHVGGRTRGGGILDCAGGGFKYMENVVNGWDCVF